MEIDALAKRLRLVERQARIWRVFAVFAMLVMVIFMMIVGGTVFKHQHNVPIPKDLRVRSLIVENSLGKDIAVLGAFGDHTGRLILGDAQGQVVFQAGVNEHKGGALILYAGPGRKGLVASTRADHTAGLMVDSGDGYRTYIGPGVGLFDTKDQKIARWPAEAP